jgi:hypothetical protein
MTHRALASMVLASLAPALVAAPVAAQGGPMSPPGAVTVPLSSDAWIATDSIRSVRYLDRPALWINRGVALVRGASMENGTLDLDVAASDTTNFLGVAFRAASPLFSNVVFLRPGASGTEEAVQYGPAFNSVGVAWQVYHGDGANAVADLRRNRWLHLRVELDRSVARVFLDSATTPTLTVPRVVASGGRGIGVWAGAFGRGAYFANVRYTPRPPGSPEEAAESPALPPGTLVDWQLSQAIEAEAFSPTVPPELARLKWQRVAPEPDGVVLINRYREAPVGGVPRDSTGAVLEDSVMTGKMAGSRIVYARTTITAAREGIRRLRYAYSNGVVVYLNGRPLALAMNPGGLRGIGVMSRTGDAVYLPLHRGRNELVLAVIECTGGWAYSARLDPAEEANAGSGRR